MRELEERERAFENKKIMGERDRDLWEVRIRDRAGVGCGHHVSHNSIQNIFPL